MRKHLALSIVAGLPLFSGPAFLIGQESWTATATGLGLLGLIAVATVFSLFVFVRLESSPARSRAAAARR